MLGYVATAADASTTGASNYPTPGASDAQAGNAEHGKDPSRSDSEGSDAVPSQFDWLNEATDALGELHEIHAKKPKLIADYYSCKPRCRCYKLRSVYALPYPTLPSHEHRGQAERQQTRDVDW